MVSDESVEEAIDVIDERIEEIESDNRYPTDEDEEWAGVEINAVLALMQAEWRGEIKGLTRARNALTDNE